MAIGGQGAGRPCDVLRENIANNSGSFFGDADDTTSDDFRWMANISGVPFNVNHVVNDQAYDPTNTPPQDSWIYRVRLQKTVNGAVT